MNKLCSLTHTGSANPPNCTGVPEEARGQDIVCNVQGWSSKGSERMAWTCYGPLPISVKINQQYKGLGAAYLLTRPAGASSRLGMLCHETNRKKTMSESIEVSKHGWCTSPTRNPPFTYFVLRKDRRYPAFPDWGCLHSTHSRRAMIQSGYPWSMTLNRLRKFI